MLSLFIVAFIVTLIIAVYMNFGSQAERYVLQYKLDAEAVALIGVIFMVMLSLNGLRNSGLSNNVGLMILALGWVPCIGIAAGVAKIQQSFNELYEIGKKLDSKRTKVGIKEQQAVRFYIEMQRINDGQKDRVYRAVLAHKRYYN